jgi:L-threonylcarbamoyladenylate synthase
MRLIQENKKNVDEIITALKNGAVLILPTDTVYGLVCDASNEKAVEKIFEIKKRDKQKSLPVFVKDIEQAKEQAIINSKQEEFLKEIWPGAVTAVLKAKSGLSKLVYKQGTIALRIPNYELLSVILKEFGKPLAQTSVNISGKPSLIKPKEIIEQFQGRDNRPDLIVDAGDLSKNKSSIIIDLTKNKINILRK